MLKFSQRFSDLAEEEYYKYLEIAKKALSGSLANNLLELKFQRNETADERQRSLYALKASGLEDPALLDRFYQQVIESYDAAGNYLILVFHDVYDVIAKASDRRTLELETQVTGLKEELSARSQELQETKTAYQAALAANPEEGGDAAINLRVTPQKAKKIHAQMISGVKYLVVPLEKDDVTQINGVCFDF